MIQMDGINSALIFEFEKVIEKKWWKFFTFTLINFFFLNSFMRINIYLKYEINRNFEKYFVINGIKHV